MKRLTRAPFIVLGFKAGYARNSDIQNQHANSFLIFLVLGNPMYYSNGMNEIVFEVIQEADGGFVAECLTESIFTQADSWDELRRNVKEATEAYFYDKVQPPVIRLHLIRDEVLATA